MLMGLVTRLVSPQKNSKTFREGKTMDEFMQAAIEEAKRDFRKVESRSVRCW